MQFITSAVRTFADWSEHVDAIATSTASPEVLAKAEQTAETFWGKFHRLTADLPEVNDGRFLDNVNEEIARRRQSRLISLRMREARKLKGSIHYNEFVEA